MGCTALYYAELKNHGEVAAILEAKGGESIRKASPKKAKGSKTKKK